MLEAIQTIEVLKELSADFIEHIHGFLLALASSSALSFTSVGCNDGILAAPPGIALAMLGTFSTPDSLGPPAAASVARDAPEFQGEVEGEDKQPSLMTYAFPDYFAGSFLESISLVQCLGFMALLLVGHVGLVPTACSLYHLGASWGPSIAMGGLWRLFTPLLLHGSVSHLLANVVFQLRLGFKLERQYGTPRFGAMYLLSGLFGNLISAACNPWKLAVGCSSSGMGIVGSNVARVLLQWNHAPSQSKVWVIYFSLVLLAGLATTGNTDVFGHLGGFVGGFCVTLLMNPACQVQRTETPCGLSCLQWLALTVLATSTALAGGRIYSLEPLKLNC